MGKRKAKKKKKESTLLQVKTAGIHGGLSDYTEYHVAQCTEFAICISSCISLSF